MTKLLPKELTSYDLLKTLAVAMMIIDHIGYYLYPEAQWMRVVGRLCVPMWFFLIGFAKTRDVPPKMWIGAIILVAGSVIYGHYIFALNILFTMIVIRFTLDAAVNAFMRSKIAMAGIGFVFLVSILPTSLIFEYGTTGYIFAFLGYFVRQKNEGALDSGFITLFIPYAFFSYLMTQPLIHGFSLPMFYALALGTIVVLFGLAHFKSRSVGLSLPAWISAALKFSGRHTLEIYVVHIIILGFLAMSLGDPRFGLMDWEWIPALW